MLPPDGVREEKNVARVPGKDEPPVFPLQLGGGGARRTHPVAFRAHHQGGDQRGATHQPQREQKTVGEGQGRYKVGAGAAASADVVFRALPLVAGFSKPLPSRQDEQLEVAPRCGKEKVSSGHNCLLLY